MSFEAHLKQTLTYWAPGSRDLYGKPSWAAPVQKACRWEDKQIAIINKQGVEINTKSRIFLAEPLDIDGFVFKGTTSNTNPSAVNGSLEIQQLDTMPDLSNVKTLYTVFC